MPIKYIQAKAYIVNMPCELLSDGYLVYCQGKKATDKPHKDRYLRSALLLLYSAVEAELNRQLNITTQGEERKIGPIHVKLGLVLTNKRVDQTTQLPLLAELDGRVKGSFRDTRNGVAHFKGDYGLYGITENNIDRYFQFTKTVFEKIHSPKVISEWLAKAEKSA